jgi:rod shape determining protein RodA
MSPRLKWLSVDLNFLVPWILIMMFSLLMLFSITSPPGDYGLEGDESASYTVSRGFFHRQILWVGIGLLALAMGSIIPFRIYKDYLAWIMYGAGLLLFVILLIIPSMRGGTHRWLVLGPIGIQPSEFFKVVMIIILASFLTARRGDPNSLKTVIQSLALVLPPTLLVLRQPDLGTALTYIWLMFPILLWRGLTMRRLLIMISPLLSAFIVLYGEIQAGEGLGAAHVVWGLFMVLLFLLALFYREMPVLERVAFYLGSVCAGLLVPRLWSAMLPYQQKRILVFMDPEMDPLGAGYQIFQSKVAIGSGGILGRGFLQGTQKGLAFLPARHTDFIFSVVGEEFGFVGAMILLCLYGYLIIHGFKLAGRARHPFAQLLAVGTSAYLLFHVFVNVAMTIGLAPVTGLPLPGMSFGGSVLVATSFLMGLQMNISRNWSRY